MKKMLIFLGSMALGLSLLACAGADGSGLPDACSPACGDHGVCDAFSTPAVCQCFPGWQGEACDSCSAGYKDDGLGNCVPVLDDPTTCSTNSCSGHGWCDDGTGKVVCTCDEGYEGKRCDACESGFHLDNHGACVEDVNCSNSDPCGVHGTCIDGADRSYCECDTGYGGSTCSDCASGYHLEDQECVADEHCPAQDPCDPGGVCDDTGGVVSCHCNEGYSGALCDQCAPGYVDLGNGCERGTSCQDFVFVDDAYVYELVIGNGNENNPCAMDLTGDGIADNAYGHMLSTMGELTGTDVNQLLTDNISSGILCQVYDVQDLDSVENDDFIGLSLMQGTDSDDNYENNLDGSEEFTVDAQSFVFEDDTCTMEPMNIFDVASVSQGVVSAQAQSLDGIELPSFLDPETLSPVPLFLAKLTAEISQGANGIILENGKIGGAIPVNDMCTQVNDYVAANCECLGLDGPLLACGVDGDSYNVECNSAASNCEQGSTCDSLGSYCNAFAVMFSNADMDTDSDGIADSMSVGMCFSATSATVTGITQ